MGNQSRTDAFRRNPYLESMIERLNSLLQSRADTELERFESPELPLILVIGGPRSGTTLMMQWLAASGYFGYPSNLLARFYKAPHIGALIHEMLINPKYQYKNDFMDIRPYTMHSSFSSDLGKTEGLAAPNVFWYFWRRFFDFNDCTYLDEEKRKSADTENFARELAAVESVFEKPFAMKGIIINWNLEFIDRLFRKVLFIHMRRNPAYQMLSILKARERFRGDRRLWWGFKPPQYDALNLRTPEEEVAAQIYYTRSAIDTGFDSVADERQLTVDYEQFCEDPGRFHALIKAKLSRQGYALPGSYQGQSGFDSSNGPYTDSVKSLEAVYSGMR
ncbi:MAG: sulfotransferase [Candidatus Thiodiazotropha sp. (ex Ctena orbiculata)]|nr:sulfotransferase [Candidatus Thiodiazotropha taylori]MBT3000589.1 sulfotransferase [Candidatus Thiodiazotropha taylori]